MLDVGSPVDAARPQRPGRRRLPQRVYWRRRIAVLVVLGLVGWAGFTAVSGLVGGDDDPSLEIAGAESDAVPADADDPVVAPSDSDAESDVVAGEPTGAQGAASAADVDGASDGADSEAGSEEADGEVEAEAAASTDDEAEPEADTDSPGPPSVDDPAKVHIVGDSDAGTFGPYLQTLLDNTLIATTSLDYKVSSGLARPDFFNWPDELRATLPEVDPDIIVVTFGGNDSQGLSKPQDDLEWVVADPMGNPDEWSAEYQRRVLEVLDILLENDREVVWVGIPNDDNPDVTARLKLQDDAVRAALAERPEVVFVDTWTRFSGRDGNWAEFVVDPRDGIGKDVRADDGFHLNVTGAEILAIDIAVAVRDILREQGASI